MDGFINTVAQTEGPAERRIYGVVVGQVIDNVDLAGRGRVKVRCSCLHDIEPWARVAVLMAGAGSGTYFIPGVGDEVLVTFHQGDTHEPYVVGSLWNGQDVPPTQVPTDACTRRIMRTPAGHEVEFDDLNHTISIVHSAGHKIVLAADKTTVATEGDKGDTATITLDRSGSVAVEASRSLSLKAPSIRIEGERIEVKSSATTDIDGGASCDIHAALVRIN